MKTRWLTTAILAILSLGHVEARAADEAALAGIVERVMETGLSPGMAVAVVRDGRVVLERGFGAADLESGRRVETSTRFYIASTTKALSALAALRLAARGELDLDQTLDDGLPRASWHPDLRPDSIRVRDLLTLTHGIGDGPVTFRIAYSGEADETTLLRVLAEHGPAPWGRAFNYDNLGYDLLGLVISARTGRTWREALEREVLEPLSMRTASTRRSLLGDEEVAVTYELGPAGFERCLSEKTDANMGPANGLFCTAGDLARLLLAELQEGRVDGRPAIDPAVILDSQKPHTRREPEGDPFRRTGWGMGWDIGTYHGQPFLSRNGDFAGWHSHVSFLPEAGMGIVVLVNGGGAAAQAAHGTAAMLYDHLLGRAAEGTAVEELATMKTRVQTALAAEREKRAARPQVLPLPFAAYAGTYENPAWGTVTLYLDGDRLAARLGVLRCAVEVFDGTKHQLRLDLAGRGNVLTAVVPEGAPTPTQILFQKRTYPRR